MRTGLSVQITDDNGVVVVVISHTGGFGGFCGILQDLLNVTLQQSRKGIGGNEAQAIDEPDQTRGNVRNPIICSALLCYIGPSGDDTTKKK